MSFSRSIELGGSSTFDTDVSENKGQGGILRENRNIKAVEIDGVMITEERLMKMKSVSDRIALFAKILDEWGIDGLIGMLTGAGDITGALFSLYPILEAIRFGYPKKRIAKMAWNSTKDLGLGIIPLVGDIVDFFYNGNMKNKELFDGYFKEIESHFHGTVEGEDTLRGARKMGAVMATRISLDTVFEK